MDPFKTPQTNLWFTLLLCCFLLPGMPLKAQTKTPAINDLFMQQSKLIDVAQLDTTLRVHIVYATDQNFLGKNLYEGITKAWLRDEVARMVVKANQLLKAKHPSYTLLILDAARPIRVQQQMWNSVVGTKNSIYVSNPARGGGLHNYGAAVDVTILDENGKPLPMGTAYDHFGKEAHIDNEAELVATGKITAAERANRLLLRDIMRKAGFRTIRSEWWHFNAYSRAYAVENLPLIH